MLRSDRMSNHVRPLVSAYWLMPLAAGLAVIVTAAGMLIETLVLANRIDTNVTPIEQSVAGIKVNTDTIAVLATVDASAKGILAAAGPLTGQASTILTTVQSIQGTVGQIDTATGSIDSKAGAIDNTVASIAPHVLGIAVPVESIQAKLPDITGKLSNALSLLGGVKGDTASLLSQASLPTILDHAHSINCKLGPGDGC